MKKIFQLVVAFSIAAGFVSCTKNYPQEVNKRVIDLKQQGAEILARSNDETGAEHYVLYRTDTELVYDGIDFKSVLLEKGKIPNELVLDIDSLSPDLITKQIPYNSDVVNEILDELEFKKIKNGFIIFSRIGHANRILSCFLPNVIFSGGWTSDYDLTSTRDKGTVTYYAGEDVEYFLRKVYGDVSLLNTMRSTVRGGIPERCYMHRTGYVDAKGNVVEKDPHFNITELSGNRPAFEFDYPAEQLKDKEGIVRFIGHLDDVYLKEVVEPDEAWARQWEEEERKERERERQQELQRNTLVNYECSYCHTIIQTQDRGTSFSSGKCPAAGFSSSLHTWWRL